MRNVRLRRFSPRQSERRLRALVLPSPNFLDLNCGDTIFPLYMSSSHIEREEHNLQRCNAIFDPSSALAIACGNA